MKKIIIILLGIFLLTGCTQIKDLSYEEILGTISTSYDKANIYRTGYKYYLPRGMKLEDSTLYNEVIGSKDYLYYLYIDAVSYYNEVKSTYQVKSESYYSKSIEYDGKYGYLEINLVENEKYMIEIMYNYAKIEVIVEEKDINESLLNAINILKSIQYNDTIISNLLGSSILNFVEEEFNIFNTTSSDSEYIKIDNSYHEEEEEKVLDTDLIK